MDKTRQFMFVFINMVTIGLSLYIINNVIINNRIIDNIMEINHHIF